MARCNCENSACSHLAGACRMPAEQDKRLMYVGAVCKPCWDRCDDRYRLDDEQEGSSHRISCPHCQLARINLTLCHERGCPNANARWDAEQQTWIKRRECRECGCTVDHDDPCCSAEQEGE